MSRLTFDFNGAMAEAAGAHGFDRAELGEAGAMLNAAFAGMDDRGEMAWRALPEGQEDVVRDIEATAADIRANYEHFVVLGIGGSALGPIAVYQALSDGDCGIDFAVEDNVDPERLARVFGRLNLAKTMFNVVTKSGKTSETMAQMMAVAGMLEEAGLALKDHVIATTDEKNGNLRRIADQEGLKSYVIPAGVGGRFSELCPVGLLPAAVCGFDIRAMLAGAAEMERVCTRKTRNPAATYALLHVLGMKRGMNVAVMMPYADSLKYISDWFAQIWAESLGKRRGLGGKDVFAGQTPVKALGVTDQHSQVQLYTEGPFDKIFTFLRVGELRRDLEIPEAFSYVDDIAFLGGKTFGQLLEAERSATEYALMKAGRPSITITLPAVDAASIGALLYFFEMATAFAGEMLGINTFDQPGVEEGKLATFALMGKPGFEQKKAEMDARPAKDPDWIFD